MRAVTIAALGSMALVLPGFAAPHAQTAAAAESEEAKHEFKIPAQPLSQALREYAQQSGDQVVFYSQLGKGRESAAVEGRYTRQEALQKLLENTGLKHQRVNAKTVVISAAANQTRSGVQRTAKPAPLRLVQASTPAGGAQRPPREAALAVAAESLFGVEEVIVTGTAAAERTKFDASVAISTFSAADIAQQAPASSADLIAAVPGFWVEATAGTTQGNVFARGIVQDGGYRYVGLMEDGIALYPVFELSFYNPDQFVRVDETIERVEALRGGTAPIFTAGAVGGTVNFVTRSPRAAPESVFKAGFSDYGTYRGDVSWVGPVGEQWGLAVGGYYRRSDGVREPGYAADQGGQVRFKLGRDFAAGDLEIFAKYIDDRSLFVVPVPLTGNPSEPRGLNGADPGTYSLHSEDLARAGLPPSAAQVGLRGADLEDGIHPQIATFGARLNWQLSEAVSATNLARYTAGEVHFDAIFPGDPPTTGAAFAAARGVEPSYTVLSSGAAYAPTQLVQNHGHWAVHKAYRALQDDLRLSLRLDAHALALGVYGADYSMADRWSLGNLLLMDVGDQPRRLSLAGVTDPHGFTQYSFLNLIADYDATQYALYASDEWRLTDQLRIDVGVRYDREEIDGAISNAVNVDLDADPATPWDNQTSQAGAARRVAEQFDDFGWSIGFNYALTAGQAIFGHYTDAAKLPNFDDVRNGVLIEDNVTNVELGYKVSLPSFVVFATLFQTQFDNVPFQDILVGGQTVVRRARTRTRGIEIEGELQPTDAFSVRFGITRMDPQYRRFTGSSVDNTGNTIRRIPKTMARLMPAYSFWDQRARVFLTFTYAGERFANDENTIRLPSYRKLDGGVRVEVARNWTLQLSGENLTDEIGLTEGNPRTDVGAGGIGNIYLVRPLFGRSFTGSVTYRF